MFGDRCLKDVYPKLYLLSVQNTVTVVEIFNSDTQGRKWALEFRRNLFEWECPKLQELDASLKLVAIDEQKSDIMQWKPMKDELVSRVVWNEYLKYKFSLE